MACYTAFDNREGVGFISTTLVANVVANSGSWSIAPPARAAANMTNCSRWSYFAN
jgi:hypothetical protein